jgi:hypothetical protein
MTVPGNLSSPLLATAAEAAAAAVATKSLRFNSGDSAYLHRTPSSAGNLRTHTFAAWIKRSALGGRQTLFRTNTSEMHYSFAESAQGSENGFMCYGGAGAVYLVSDPVFRDPSAWFHLCVAWDTTQSTSTDRLKLYINGVRQESWKTGTFPSQNFEGGLNKANKHGLGANSSGGELFSGYLADVYFIDGSALSPVDNFIELDDNGVYQAKAYSGTFGTNGFHLLDFANESTIGHDSSGNENDFTANNFGTGGNGNYISELNSVNDFYGNGRATWGPTLFNGATGDKGPVPAAGTPMTYTPSSSITLTGTGLRIWVSRNKGGLFINGTSVSSTEQQWNSFGTTYSPLTSIEWRTTDGSNFSQLSAIEINGTQLIDNTAVGADNDILFDVPTNGTQSDTGAGGEVSGNYCTLNPLLDRYNIGTSGTKTFSEGNLKIVATTGDSTRSRYLFGTIGVSSGKWYYEMKADNTAGGIGVGFAPRQFADEVGSISVRYNSPGSIIIDGTTNSSLASFTNGDFVGVALDLDNNTVQFYKNGSTVGSAYSVTSGYTYLPLIVIPSTGTSSTGATFNFGQRAFAYSAPSGYKALCTTNLPTPTIADGSTAFGALTYSGNGSARTLTGLNMNPDFIWIKSRSAAQKHVLVDSVRTTSTGEYLASDSTQAEGTGVHISGTTNGITIADPNAATIWYNDSSHTYVAWAWDAGSSTVSNTDGTITTSQRVNQSAGISISTYTGNGTAGATWGHGLNDVPDVIIIKARDSVTDGSWIVGHSAIGLGHGRLLLNATNDNNGSAGNVVAYDLWNNTAATSSVVSIGSYNAVNDSGDDYLALCFTAVAGYSAFGSYEGNGQSGDSGPFVHLGFRAKFILLKNADLNGSNWFIFDTSRNTFNVVDLNLKPNSSAVEETDSSGTLDILSNGFKMRSSGTHPNGNGNTITYMAFAENPFSANGGLAR